MSIAYSLSFSQVKNENQICAHQAILSALQEEIVAEAENRVSSATAAVADDKQGRSSVPTAVPQIGNSSSTISGK